MTKPQPRQLAERALMPDLLRAFALVGIAVVNVVGFAQPASSSFLDAGLESVADRIAFGAMGGLFLMKSYPLFAMMFGAGLAWQLAAAERDSADASGRYFRRIAALSGLGVLHFIFFWYGDILITYAILGCLLFAFRNMQITTLIRTGAALILLNTVLLLLLAALFKAGEIYSPEAMAEAQNSDIDATQIAAFTQGSFLDAAGWRLGQMPMVLPAVLLQQGTSVFGFFCFGLAAVKAGTIDQPQARIWRLSRRVFLPVGLAGSALGTWILLGATGVVSARFMLGSAVLMAFSSFSALGYAGVLALFASRTPGRSVRFLARAGSASLTAYLFQSLFLSFIFAGYGLGHFGEMSASKAIPTALLVALASLAFTGVWRSYAARGPVEVLLRRVTYWGRA